MTLSGSKCEELPELSTFDIRPIQVKDALNDSQLVAQWESLLALNPHVNSMFASPNWLGHLESDDEAAGWLWVARDAKQQMVGVMPIRRSRYELQFSVANRVFFRNRRNTAFILGGFPISFESSILFEELVVRVFQSWPDCQAICSEALPVASPFDGWLRSIDRHPANFYLHVVDGPRPWHLLQLSSSMEAYLGSMSSKGRGALRRKVKLVSASTEGKLDVRCVTQSSGVVEFLQLASEIGQRSWQHRVLGPRVVCDERSIRKYSDLADRGLLRAYLLQIDGTPCAFVVGHQFNGVYHYSELGFREDFAEHSPGTVLLYAIIEDLHQSVSDFTMINFGVGDATYKRRFGNIERSDATCLILRRNFCNRLLTASHSAFQSSINIVKKWIGRRVSK